MIRTLRRPVHDNSTAVLDTPATRHQQRMPVSERVPFKIVLRMHAIRKTLHKENES